MRAYAFSILLFVLVVAAPAMARSASIGAMGDSLTDEYNDGPSYGAYAQNWVQLLAAHRALDFGPTAADAGQPDDTWLAPRNGGFEYNWALAGATSTDLVAAGQHTGLAAQHTDYATLMIGANDQHDLANMYLNVYSGAWSAAQITAWINGVAANIDAAVSAFDGSSTKLVLTNSIDFGFTPLVNTIFPTDGAARQVVTDLLVNEFSPAIRAIAQAHHLVFVDTLAATNAMIGPQNALYGDLLIGNVAIQMQAVDNPDGSNPTAGFVDDGLHPNTTVQGVFANLMLAGLNAYGANIPYFSEQEILANRGLAYGGSDTLFAQIGAYESYVTDYSVIPEPSTWLLSSVGATALVLLMRHRKTRA